MSALIIPLSMASAADAPGVWKQRSASLAVVNPPVRSKWQEVISMRGKWDFATDPKGEGRDAGWMQPGAVWPGQREIEVPGCWEAQGVGEPGTSRIWGISRDANPYPLRHIYMGAAWYRRGVILPEAWAGKRIWLKVGGVRAQGWFWVNGHPVAQVENYCAVNKYDVTDLVVPGKEASVVAVVRNDLPSRMGQVSALHRWGGLYRDVELEASPATWIDNCRVESAFDRKSAIVHVTVCTADKELPKPLVADIQIRTLDGKPAGTATHEISGKDAEEFSCEVPILDFRPWSPDSPNLYVAEVTLRESGRTLHGWAERFGLRKLEVQGDRIFLNNEPFFVRGYGDDYIYPLTLCSPASREAHRKNLEVARRSGFNYVRHHTHTEIPEFYDAADELGILVQPELPYYQHDVTDQFPFDPKRDLTELMTHYRRYVSLATYCMGNEGNLGSPLDNELYQMVKRIDPARLVLHQDGGKGNTKANSDFLSGPIQPWKPGSFACDAPYVAHEYLNLGLKSDPRLDPKFSGPYAAGNDLKSYEANLERAGLSRAWGDACLDAGHALQQYYQKQGIESARRDPTCDGYSFWTLVDVLCKQLGEVNIYAGQGLYNAFWEQKSGGASPEEFFKFNGPTALLMRPDWKIAVAGESVDVALSVSHFGAEAFKDATLDWTLREGSNVLASGSLAHLDVPIGDVRELGVAKVTIPELTRPVHAMLEARMGASNGWDFWLFPKRTLKDGKGMAASDDLYPILSALYPGIARAGTPEGEAAGLLVTTTGDIAAIEAGRRIVLLELDDPKPNVSLAWWWIGDQAGTAMAKHPVFGSFPHSGVLSPLWFEIVKHADLVRPGDAYRGAEPLMVGEGILGYYVYLSQARIGKGRLLRASGLDLMKPNAPESIWLLDEILGYARSDAFVPQSSLEIPGIAKHWQQRKALHADLGNLNAWSNTRKAAARNGWMSQGKSSWVSVLKMEPGKNELEWETAAVPQEERGETVTFNWFHGVGFSCWNTSADHRQRMTLQLNGKDLLKCALDVSDSEWTVTGGGATLRYRGLGFSKIESSGLMSLTVPRSLLNPGQPNCIKLVGEIGEDRSGWNGIIETGSLKGTQ